MKRSITGLWRVLHLLVAVSLVASLTPAPLGAAQVRSLNPVPPPRNVGSL
jgi:hypothetical protein